MPKTPEQLQKMRAAGRVAHAALDLAEQLIHCGTTTEEMDRELHTFICHWGEIRGENEMVKMMVKDDG